MKNEEWWPLTNAEWLDFPAMEESFAPNVLEADAPPNPIADKSFAFAERIVRMYRHLLKQGCEKPLADQILRSGTSIGANVEEALGAFTKREFASKMSISYKEARETNYWLRLLLAVDSLAPQEFASMHADCDSLCRMLRAILNTLRQQAQPANPKPTNSPT